jgi:hypothetical protein
MQWSRGAGVVRGSAAIPDESETSPAISTFMPPSLSVFLVRLCCGGIAESMSRLFKVKSHHPP